MSQNNQKAKSKFRASKKWKDFRDKKRKEQKLDPVTGAKLTRRANLHHLDLNEAKSILKVQKQLESGMYDDSMSIEIGKLIKAKEFVNIKSTRLPSGSYSINITLFNVETGAILGMFSSPNTYDSSESYALQAHYDCISEILSRLGIKLTQEGKNVLQNEKKIAAAQAQKNKEVAKVNAKIEEER